MTTKWALCLLISAAMTGAFGCDDDDDGGFVSSGVSSSKQLDELTEAEARDMCEEFTSAPGEVFDKEALCRIASFSAARVVANSEDLCRTTYDICMGSSLTDAASILPKLAGDIYDCDPDDFDEDGEYHTCDATVGELERCANDLIAAYDSMIVQMTCDNLGALDWPDRPHSCEVVEEKCP